MTAHCEIHRKHIHRANRRRQAKDQVLQKLSGKATAWYVSGPGPHPHYHKKTKREEEKGWREGRSRGKEAVYVEDPEKCLQ